MWFCRRQGRLTVNGIDAISHDWKLPSTYSGWCCVLGGADSQWRAFSANEKSREDYPSCSPKRSLKMKLSLNFFFFGWWLARQCWTSRGQTPSTPRIRTSFNGTVGLGERVTILCMSKDDFDGEFFLTRHNKTDITMAKKAAESNQAAFSLSPLSQSHGGIYSCRSCLHIHCSPFSDKICLNLTDPSLTKPCIQVINAKAHPFTSIDLRCEGTELGLTFALLKSKKLIDYKATEPGEKAVDFYLNHAKLKETKSYTCQYHPKSNPFLWSVPSDPLEFPLRNPKVMDPTILCKDPKMMTPTMKMIPERTNDSVIHNPYLWAGIGVSVFLLVMLLLAVVLYRKRRKSSKTNEGSPAMNLSSGVEEHPDEVSYASLNHQSQQYKQGVDPRQTSEPCLYASVVENSTFRPYMT